MSLFSKASSSTAQVTTTTVQDLRTAGGQSGITAGPSSHVSYSEVGQDAPAVIASAADIIRAGMEGVYDFAEASLGMALASSEKASKTALQTSGNVAESAIASASSLTPAPDWARVVPWLVSGAVVIALAFAIFGRR